MVWGLMGWPRLGEARCVRGGLRAALGGGVSSRLFRQIREQRGLAYSTYSFTSSYAGDGLFGLYAGCQPGKADEVVSIMTAVLRQEALLRRRLDAPFGSSLLCLATNPADSCF